MLGEIMRTYPYKVNEVFALGYYEAHRLCTISEELRAHDFEMSLIAGDYSQSQDDYRKDVAQWSKNAQPRRYKTQTIPDFVIADLERRIKEAREAHG